MTNPTPVWLNALAFLVGYGAAELQHRNCKHLRSMAPRRREPDPPELFIPFDEGPIARSTNRGGPTTPKPDIIPKPQFPPPRTIREDFLP